VTGEKFVKLYKNKVKKGVVDRVVDNYTIIVKDLFDKDMDLQQFIGKEVILSNGDFGRIDGAFGKSGKIRVIFKEMLKSLEL
jgi:selenocysteine-specific elongation factor